MLGEARRRELDYVEITTTPDNVASQRVIIVNGGRFVEEFHSPYSHGGDPTLRFRIALIENDLKG
jgi:predicted acetyltransferase